MIVIILLFVGLCLGSFVNALVWRLHEQRKQSPVASRQSPDEQQETSDKRLVNKDLSILKGRSMCPNCQHELATIDLIPVLSWLWLRGKCRYCHRPISWQYPLVELATALLFLVSYLFLPHSGLWALDSGLMFVFWLAFLVGFVALTVYDLRWMVLPNRIIYPLLGLALIQAVWSLAISDQPVRELLNQVTAALVGGGLFYVLFQLSKERWIGGGDVKLGFLLGLVVGTPAKSFLVIFIASILGTLAALPLLARRRLNRRSQIPFGPFLIMAAITVHWFGSDILHWYTHLLLLH